MLLLLLILCAPQLDTPISKIDGLSETFSRNGYTWYQKKNEKLSYQGVPLKQILYGAKDGKLAVLELWTNKTGKSFEYECTDVEPKGMVLHGHLKKSMKMRDRFDTNLTHDHPMLNEAISDCNALKAYNCITYTFVTPPGSNPSDRELISTLTTFQWVRDRTRFDLSPEEIERVKKRQPVPTSEYTCQHRVRFMHGETRKQIDDREKARRELLKSFE